MGLIRNLLGRTFFPDNDWTHDKEGAPIRPYDLSTDTMDEFMGVRVDAVEGPIKADMTLISEAPLTPGKVTAGGSGYVLSTKMDNAFMVGNLLQKKGVGVRPRGKATEWLNPGAFLVGKSAGDAIP